MGVYLERAVKIRRARTSRRSAPIEISRASRLPAIAAVCDTRHCHDTSANSFLGLD